MTYKEAKKNLKKVGSSKATKFMLAAMYAETIVSHHNIRKNCINEFYEKLKDKSDNEITEISKKCLIDMFYAMNFLWS